MMRPDNRQFALTAAGPTDASAALKGPSLLQNIRDRLAVRNQRLLEHDSETLDLLSFCHQALVLELRGCASSLSGPFYSGETGERRWRDVLIGERGNLSLKDVCRLATSQDPRARAAARRVARHILTEACDEERESPTDPLVELSEVAAATGTLVADMANDLRDGELDPAVILPACDRVRHEVDDVEALVDAGLREQLQVRRPVAAREARQ